MSWLCVRPNGDGTKKEKQKTENSQIPQRDYEGGL